MATKVFHYLSDSMVGEKGFKNKIKQNKLGYDQCSLTRTRLISKKVLKERY